MAKQSNVMIIFNVLFNVFVLILKLKVKCSKLFLTLSALEITVEITLVIKVLYTAIVLCFPKIKLTQQLLSEVKYLNYVVRSFMPLHMALN